MQKAVDQHFDRKKKQKMIVFIGGSQQDELSKLSSAKLYDKLSQEQKVELDNYMKRIKSEYL